MKKIFLFLCIAYASPALALTCLNDYSGTAGCASNEEAAGDCATLGYSTENVSGCTQYLYCPFDTSYKKCVADNSSAAVDCNELGFTASDKSEWCSKIVACKDNEALTLCANNLTCGSNEILINGDCKKVYSSCSAAQYYAPSECTAGYTCSGETTIYTSTTGTTATCYKSRMQKFCPEGYATKDSLCLSTPEGKTCGSYLLKKLINSDATHYTGELPCYECTCGTIKENCFGSTVCPTGANCSSCQDSNGKTLYTVTSCQTGYVEDGDGCYNCKDMATRMNAAIKKGSGNGYKSYVQACYGGRWCVKDTSTTCSGDNGTRAWDQYCLCSIIGNTYCMKTTSVEDKVVTDPDRTSPCSDAEKKRCEAARDAFNAKVTEHNSKCPNNKVTGTISFNCNSYLPESDNMSPPYISMCSYVY